MRLDGRGRGVEGTGGGEQCGYGTPPADRQTRNVGHDRDPWR